ncbi:MAG: hypothetical protein Q9205_006494 [Flavoplaca limonia]
MSSVTISQSRSILAAGFAIVAILAAFSPWKPSLEITLGPRVPHWDILYHLGGNGPWIKKIDGIVDGGIDAPEGCEVEQISRHGERYPTSTAGDRMLTLLQRIKDSNITLKGDLEFVNDWQYFSLGGIPKAQVTNFWASDCNRVIETARYFATGFFGLDWNSTTAKLHVIPETSDLGANTLTPGDTCIKYVEDLRTGHDYGLIQLSKFRSTYLPAISARFQTQNPGIKFTDGEIYSMQEMCGFEILVRGSSPWCNVFNHNDWLNFEYARDVIHYYRAGPGNRFGPAMGWLWLNATANLLAKGPNDGKFFFSFVHDGDIVPMLAALDLFPSTEHLPTSHRPETRQWRTSQVLPMNGRVIFERLRCKHVSKENPTAEDTETSHYVRININDGIVALPGCTSGPGSSCPLENLLAMVQRRGGEIGDFHKICGLGKDAPARIEFLHQ